LDVLTDNVRIGVIGGGGWGKNHLRVFNELGVLQCLCEIDPIKAQKWSAKYRVNAYTDIEKMLDTERLDAVTICTPSITHFDMASRTLKRGINTFVEKPMTATSLDGKKLLQLSKTFGAFLTVGFVERFNPAVIDAKEAIKNRELGEPLLLEFHREDKMGRIMDVGIIADTSAHDIDTARWLLNEEPSSVFARVGRVISKDREDFAVITLGFGRTKSAFIMSNGVTPKKVKKLTIVCTKGVMTIDFVSQEVRFDDSDGTRIPRREFKEPLTSEMEMLIESIRNGRKPLVRPLDGLNNTIIAEAALLSSELGEPIMFDDFKGRHESDPKYWHLPLGESEITEKL
jgi:UDP-N-acetylglucosamine 3-dehydrogenase